MLAPLFDTAVNRARAPVKFLDAARLGADVTILEDQNRLAMVMKDGAIHRIAPGLIDCATPAQRRVA